MNFISLFEPHCGEREFELVRAVLQSARWSDGPMLEGVKPPYVGGDVDEVNWMLYVVHLGKRFSASPAPGRR